MKVANASAQITLVSEVLPTKRDTSRVPPLVSIVVPVFNGMPHLVALTESLLAQTYPDLEIIFSEGGGTDGSMAYLTGIQDPRVRLVSQTKGTSAAQNWTAVTHEARGEFIKLVCQDDILAPFAIEHQLNDLQAHPSAVMAIGRRNIVDTNGKVIFRNRGCQRLKDGLNNGPQVIRTAYHEGTNVIGEPVAVLFKRDPLLQAMPWNDDNPLVLDLTCYEKVAELGDVVVRKEVVGSFRVSTSSWSTRLAKVQLHQYQAWQKQYERNASHSTSRIEKMQAGLGAHLHTSMRRGAYMWLRINRSLHSKHDQ